MGECRIHVKSDERTIIGKVDEYILESAIRNGVKIKVGCKGGGCGICKIQVHEGNIDRGICSRSVLAPEEIELGFALACQAKPKGDIIISYNKNTSSILNSLGNKETVI